jgi:hypothetical protein
MVISQGAALLVYWRVATCFLFGKKIPPPLTFNSGDCLWKDIPYPELKNIPLSKFYFWEKVLFSGVVT